MAETFDPVEFLDYIRRSWRFLLAATGSAVVVALIGSLIVPKEYTASASILIEPPGASDPRVATAVSPIYLESLKTYEQFAASDTLFAQACEKFRLLASNDAPYLESFKQKVLKVTKPKETKLLQISVTLRDPKQAQAVVQFLGESTVNLNRTISSRSDLESVEEANRQLDKAKTSLERARKDAAASANANSETLLKSQIESLAELDALLRSRLASARADAAEAEGTDAAPALKMRRARVEALSSEQTALAKELTAKSAALGQAAIRREGVEADLRAAQVLFESASKRVQEVSAARGLRGEQLRIIDAGIVPQRPSFPNIPLNCAAASLLAAVAAFGWVTFRFGLERHRTSAVRPALRVASGGSR